MAGPDCYALPVIQRPASMLTLMASLSLVLACQGRPPEPSQETAADTTPVATTSASASASAGEVNVLVVVTVGPWADYPAPKEAEWPTEPLSLKRWATASAELACAGRAFLGDPEKQRQASQRILHHHSTTANDVMTYGISLNAAEEHSLTMGELVAEAAERCR